MTKRSRSAPATAPTHDAERGGAALLIIDMINCFDFTGGEVLRTRAEGIVGTIGKLRREMAKARAPVVYVNDNFGEWHSEKSKLIARARKHDRKIVGKLAPKEDDYFIIKPQFSGFYATNLPLLLPKLGVSRLILTGVAADICVLFTAADAHMRDYALWVPEDAVAAEVDERAGWALEIMQSHLGAETAPTTALDSKGWMKRLDEAGAR